MSLFHSSSKKVAGKQRLDILVRPCQTLLADPNRGPENRFSNSAGFGNDDL